MRSAVTGLVRITKSRRPRSGRPTKMMITMLIVDNDDHHDHHHSDDGKCSIDFINNFAIVAEN